MLLGIGEVVLGQGIRVEPLIGVPAEHEYGLFGITRGEGRVVPLKALMIQVGQSVREIHERFELALAQIAADKGLTNDDVLEAVRAAVDSAYRDLPGALDDIDVHVDGQGSFSVHANRPVVETEVTDPDAELSRAQDAEID